MGIYFSITTMSRISGELYEYSLSNATHFLADYTRLLAAIFIIPATLAMYFAERYHFTESMHYVSIRLAYKTLYGVMILMSFFEIAEKIFNVKIF